MLDLGWTLNPVTGVLIRRGGDFLGGPVAKNPLVNAQDTGRIPSLGRSHMPRGSWALAPQLLTLCSRAQGPKRPSPHPTTAEARTPTACSLQQEKPPQ